MSIRIQRDVPLAPLTTLETGGPARFFLDAADVDTLREGVVWSRERSLPVYLLGGGSNVLVPDAGLEALVIRLSTRGVTIEGLSDCALVTAAAGENWDAFVQAMVAADLAGLECLSGIPGSVGAAPIQNIGAYGQEAAGTITKVEVLDLATLKREGVPAAACDFGYRDSRFRRRPGAAVVLSVTFRLVPGGPPTTLYPELARELGTSSPTLAHTRDTVIRVRRRKSMVLDDADENRRSVGSFFTNPIVAVEEAERIVAEAERTGVARADDVPRYPAGPELVKLSAAWLIEHAGVVKGTRLGRAGVSTRHTLALVNLGGASTAEVLELAAFVRKRVFDAFGVELAPEPACLGFRPPW